MLSAAKMIALSFIIINKLISPNMETAKGIKEALQCNVKTLTLFEDSGFKRFLLKINGLRKQEVKRTLSLQWNDMEKRPKSNKIFKEKGHKKYKTLRRSDRRT